MNAATKKRTIDVMLVDDHKSMLWGLQKLIESEHPRMRVVGTASNRDQVLAAAREYQPDVVLLDLDLNGESGLDCLTQLCEQGEVRVLVLTGSRDTAAREAAMMRGASGIVLKDQPAEVILKAIRCVYDGEVWLDRTTTAKVFGAFTGGGARPNPEMARIASLTRKEREVVAALVNDRGAKSHATAGTLCMSEHTLRNHLTAIYSKLQVKNRVELVMYAVEHNLAQLLPCGLQDRGLTRRSKVGTEAGGAVTS
jgi:two-component system nitrate/nitrite response regulator NarL